MASSLIRKQNLTLYKHFITTTAPTPQHTTKYSNHSTIISNFIINQQRNQNQYVKYYSRFTKRNGKDIDVPTATAAATPFMLGSGISSLRAISSRVFTKNGFIGWYLGMIESRPVLTKSVTCSLIYIAADLTSQTIALPSSEPYDVIRTLRMAGYGMLVLGPTLHYWFNFMSKILPGRDLLSTVKKMALGQTVYGPIMTVVFFSVNAALQGEDGREIVARLKRDLFPTMLNGVMYWPMCDFITFKFVPIHLQPLVSNAFSYLWTVYMTYMASLEKADA